MLSAGPVIEAGLAPGKPERGEIEIEIAVSGGVRVRIKGAVDPAAVTAAVMKARRRR